MNHIQIGFLKESAIKQFKKILPNTYFVRGSNSSRVMEESALKQKPIKALTWLLQKTLNLSNEKAKEFLIKELRKKGFSGNRIAGTIFRNKKGKRVSVVNRELLKNMDPLLSRQTIMHEAFHTKPFIGNSELLAHLYGGFAGAKKNKFREAGKEYKHLWKTRKVRSALEHAAILGGGVTVGKGIHKLTSKDDKKKNRLPKRSG